MRKTRDDTLHLRLDSEFKAQIDAAAERLDIPVAAYARMALREYLERHTSTTLAEQGTGYAVTATATVPGAPPAPSPPTPAQVMAAMPAARRAAADTPQPPPRRHAPRPHSQEQ